MKSKPGGGTDRLQIVLGVNRTLNERNRSKQSE